MQLTCIVPGWHAAVINRTAGVGSGGGGATGSEPVVEEIGQALEVRPGAAPCWWSATLQSLGLAVGETAPGMQASGQPPVGAPAANDWNGRTGRDRPVGQLMRADPVSLRADRDSAILSPPGSLGLDGDESRRLVADLNAFLVGDGLVLHAVRPTSWYLSGEGLPARLGPSPDALAFRTLDASHDVPPGASPEARADHRRLRTLQSEIEMMLHAHPVNAERRAGGRATISGLHLWGAAVPLIRDAARDRVRHPDPQDGTNVRVPDLVIGAAPFVHHAAQAAGVRLAGDATSVLRDPANRDASVLVVDLSLRSAWLSADAAALERARADFVARCLVPLREAGIDPAWRPSAGTGLRIVAESGWCHHAALPPSGRIASALARVASRTGRFLRRARLE